MVEGIFKWVTIFGNWLAKVMFLHLLWIVFSLLGLVVFGIFPATAALFSIIHRWFVDDYEVPIFRNFWVTYKKQFFKANGLGMILTVIGFFLYWDIKISQHLIQSFYFHAVLLAVFFVFFVVVLYFFTILDRYELKFFQYFKQTFLIAIARPLESIAMVVSLILLSYVFYYVPVLFFFAGAGITACPLVWFAYRACVQIEEKKLEVEGNETDN